MSYSRSRSRSRSHSGGYVEEEVITVEFSERSKKMYEGRMRKYEEKIKIHIAEIDSC